MVDVNTLRAKERRLALLRSLYTVYPRPLSCATLADALSADLRCDRATLERAMHYLGEKGYVADAGAAAAGGPTLHVLTPAGVERVERDPLFGAPRARAVRMLRLRTLQMLNLGRPDPMGVRLIGLSLASDVDLDVSEPSLRRALAYLAGHRLVREEPGDVWAVTAGGIDLAEGDETAPRVEGVAEPVDWT